MKKKSLTNLIPILILIVMVILSGCNQEKDVSIKVAPNEDNIVEVMHEYLSDEQILRVQKGYERYIYLVRDNKYTGVKGVIKAYLDVTNEYDYNQQKLKFADQYATLTQEEKGKLFLKYNDKGQFYYFFDGSKYNAYYDNTTVCLGFSDILQDYLEKKGYEVESVIAEGYALVEDKKAKIPNHKFLRVKIDDKWYYLNPGSDYDGNINSFRFILTSKEGIMRAFNELGNIYSWNEKAESECNYIFPRRELIAAFLDIRDDEITKEDGLYINIDRAIREYIQANEEYREINKKKYLVIDDELFAVLRRAAVFNQFKNLYMNLLSSKIPYRMYENVFSSFQSADIKFSEEMEKEEIQKIQKSYLSTRRVGLKTRVEYPFVVENLEKYEERSLKILLSSDLFKPLPEGKVKFVKDIQVNMTDTRIDEFRERFKYLDRLESLNFIFINNQSKYDVFQIKALKDSKMPIYYSCDNFDVIYGKIENRVYIKSTYAYFDELSKALRGKGDIRVINSYQGADHISYIEEYQTTDLEAAIMQKEDLTRESKKVSDYIQKLCDTYLKDGYIVSREDSRGIYDNIMIKVENYFKVNNEFKNAYFNALAFEQVSEDGYLVYKNQLVNSIIDSNYLLHNVKVFRNDDILSIIKDNEGIITITLKNRKNYEFSISSINSAMENWNRDEVNYVFEKRVKERIISELNKEQIK